ncbi:ATP-binding protein [Konateibacter massiliensis]|uniref:ATP-binding protein n=1 Tax=Konateibacter massiliensis TaxID=2002841 RepID=UPI000C155A37|nr:ATP-binding protein [Konateibacter massiliensis]
MTPVLAFEEMRLELQLLPALLIFLIPFVPKKNHFVIRCAASIVCLSLAALLYFPIFHSKADPDHIILLGLWYPSFVLVGVLFAKFCFFINWCDSIFITISAFAAQNICYVVIHLFVVRYLSPGLHQHLLFYVFISTLFCAILYAFIYRTFAKHLSECEGHLFEDNWKNICFYLFVFALMLTTLMHYQHLFESYSEEFLQTSCFMGITFSIFLLTVEYGMFRSRTIYKENAKLEQYLHNSENHYEMSKESIAIINRKCHDLKHQLKVLSQISNAEREEYIKEAQKDIIFYQQMVHSDSDVINTILAEKGLVCSEHQIHLSCSVDNVNLSFFRVADLYTILGNAIDNAIEYVEDFPSEEMRVINFRISQKKQFLNIQVNNPYEGVPVENGMLPHTTKHDETSHGFGLKSIKYLTEKYHGWMELSTSDGVFTLQLTFPL